MTVVNFGGSATRRFCIISEVDEKREKIYSPSLVKWRSELEESVNHEGEEPLHRADRITWRAGLYWY